MFANRRGKGERERERERGNGEVLASRVHAAMRMHAYPNPLVAPTVAGIAPGVGSPQIIRFTIRWGPRDRKNVPTECARGGARVRFLFFHAVHRMHAFLAPTAQTTLGGNRCRATKSVFLKFKRHRAAALGCWLGACVIWGEVRSVEWTFDTQMC